MDDIVFTDHKERVSKCLSENTDAHLKIAERLNELRACVLEAERNARIVVEREG